MKPPILLTEPKNYAVVQLPDRNYPGVVFQGDSLFVLMSDLAEIEGDLDGVNEELRESLGEIVGSLRAILSDYESVCERNGLDLPYVRSR